MKKIIILCLVIISITIAQAFAQPQIPDEAQKHFNRGLAATEMAKSIEDFKEAIKEFEQAKKLAPNWPDVYYNLGLLYEKVKDYHNALYNLEMYQTFLPIPLPPETVELRQKISDLSDKIEKINESERRDAAIKIMSNSDVIWVNISDDFTPLKKEEFRLSDFGVEVEVVHYTRMNEWAKKKIPPPIPGTFVPVRFDGNHFYYEYVAHNEAFVDTPYYCPAQIKTTVEGDIISYYPVRVKIKRKETLLDTVRCGFPVIIDVPCEVVYDLMWPDDYDKYKRQRENPLADKLAAHIWYRVDKGGTLPQHKLKFRKNGSQLEFFNRGVKGSEKYGVDWSSVNIEGEHFEFSYVIDNCAHNELQDKYYQCTGVVIGSRGEIVSENPLRIKVKTKMRGYSPDSTDRQVTMVEEHIYEAK